MCPKKFVLKWWKSNIDAENTAIILNYKTQKVTHDSIQLVKRFSIIC